MSLVHALFFFFAFELHKQYTPVYTYTHKRYKLTGTTENIIIILLNKTRKKYSNIYITKCSDMSSFVYGTHVHNIAITTT